MNKIQKVSTRIYFFRYSKTIAALDSFGVWLTHSTARLIRRIANAFIS